MPDYCNSPQSSVGRVHLNPELVVFQHDGDAAVLARHSKELVRHPVDGAEAERAADFHSVKQRR